MFSSLAVGWFAFTAAAGGLGAAAGRFLFPNVLFEPPQEFKAGFPEDFAVGAVDERFKATYGCWIVRESTGLPVFVAEVFLERLHLPERERAVCEGRSVHLVRASSGRHRLLFRERWAGLHRTARLGRGQRLWALCWWLGSGRDLSLYVWQLEEGVAWVLSRPQS